MMFLMSDDMKWRSTDDKIDYLFEILYDLHSMAYMVQINSDYFEKQFALEERIETLENKFQEQPIQPIQSDTIKRCIEVPYEVWDDILTQCVHENSISGDAYEFLHFLRLRSKNNWPVPPTKGQDMYANAFLNGYERTPNIAKGMGFFQKIKRFFN